MTCIGSHSQLLSLAQRFTRLLTTDGVCHRPGEAVSHEVVVEPLPGGDSHSSTRGRLLISRYCVILAFLRGMLTLPAVGDSSTPRPAARLNRQHASTDSHNDTDPQNHVGSIPRFTLSGRLRHGWKSPSRTAGDDPLVGRTALFTDRFIRAVTRPSTYTHARYLEAKRTVDDRALHRPTLDRLRDALRQQTDPIQVIEVGCGTGVMLRRLLAWDVLASGVVYHGYDLDRAAIDEAVTALRSWGRDAGYEVTTSDDSTDSLATSLADSAQTVRLRSETGDLIEATFAVADALEVARRRTVEADLLVGCAVIDLLDIETALDPLLSLVTDGVAYFPITFDGETFFQPPPETPRVDVSTERAILEAYHATMDHDTRAGTSHAGRALLGALSAADCRVLAAGGSDWLVTPPYPAAEAYFTHHLVDGIEQAVKAANKDGQERVSPAALAAWARHRHEAITDETLSYGAHNLDVLVAVTR